MWPFNKKHSIASSGILERFTDWHCHLLPGVDDGVQTMEESLQILASYEQFRVNEVWLTPHIMEDIPNSTTMLRTRYAELKAAYKGPIILHLASENMLDSLFEQRLQHGDLLPLGKEGKHLLVETSYFNPPFGLNNIFLRIKSHGYIPVLAHPERYLYMNEEDYEELKYQGVLFQLNLPSLMGMYGRVVEKKARFMLEHKMYSFCGLDLHSAASLGQLLHRSMNMNDIKRIKMTIK